MALLGPCVYQFKHRAVNDLRLHLRGSCFRTVAVLLASLIFPDYSSAQKRPRVALVLQGGGALGFAHIGVIEWLEEHHVPIDYVAGTSMGGLVGGLYASGQSPAEVAELTENIDWDTVLAGQTRFQDLSYRRKQDQVAYPNRLEFGLKGGFHLPSGLNTGHEVGIIFDRATLPYYNLKSFDDLPIPFRCVATNMVSGTKKVFDQGSLAQALRATMSLPAIFSPVMIDGNMYTDGAAVDNLPVDVAKQMGAEIIIAVYLDTGPGNPTGYNSILGAAGRNIEIMIDANELQSIKAADILVSADRKGFSSKNCNKAEEIAPRGYEAAKQKEALLSKLSVGQEEWNRYLAERSAKRRTTIPTPTFVTVEGRGAEKDEEIREAMGQLVGEPLKPDNLERELSRLMGLGYFNSLNYSLIDRNGQPGLVIRTTEKPYSPPFLNLGVVIDGSDTNDVGFGLAGRITLQNVGSFRSEWRTDLLFGSRYGVSSEYYHPLNANTRWFVAPNAFVTKFPYPVYNDGHRVAEYGQQKAGVGIDFGYTTGPRSEVRVGEQYAWYRYRLQTGQPVAPNISFHSPVTTASFTFYGQDNVVLPQRGFIQSTNFAWITSRPEGSGSVPLLEIRQNYFRPVGANGSIFLTADGGTSFGAKHTDLLGFSLGGPFRMGAFGRNELLGNQYYLFQAGYDRQIGRLSPLLGEGVYAVAFVEAGKVYGSLTAPAQPLDGSLAIVVNSALGPMYIGGSIGNNGHAKWWFGLGRIF